jgi:DNA-binding NarL/FixJ family response regulator
VASITNWLLMNRSMNPSLHLGAESAVVWIIDSLELRRVGIVSLLTPWADRSNIQIVQVDLAQALTRSDTSSVKLIVLVIGPQGIAETEPRNWIASLVAQYSDTPLVLISEREETEEVVAAFKAGARGFIPMSIAPPVAIHAFQFIMSGGSFFPPAALVERASVERAVPVTATPRSALLAEAQNCDLTIRQQQVLERLREGESNKLIARRLKLQESTVKVHIRQIMRKLGAANRTQAALSAAPWRRAASGGGGGADND